MSAVYSTLYWRVYMSVSTFHHDSWLIKQISIEQCFLQVSAKLTVIINNSKALLGVCQASLDV